MAQFVLPHDVYAARDGDWIIFLDIARNRYSAISALAAYYGDALVRREPFATPKADGGLHVLLTAQGLLRPVDASKDGARASAETASIGLGDGLAFASACVWFARRVRRGELRPALERVQIRKLRAWRAPKRFASAAPAFASYGAMRMWAPMPYVCLFNSLLLADYLLAHGIMCDLVFGVRARPFAAHCWVEADGGVLDDGEEDCPSFVEILRV